MPKKRGIFLRLSPWWPQYEPKINESLVTIVAFGLPVAMIPKTPHNPGDEVNFKASENGYSCKKEGHF